MPTEHAYPDSAARIARAGADAEKLSISMGPSHPSTHGVLRIQLELDGEVVTRADPVIGYLHRGDEKIAENMTYNQFVPYTDRLDYLAPLANNMAYAIAVEKLAKLEVPPRCQAIRVITAEMARISSHLLGLGAFGIDVGAWTVFMYTFTEREKLYKLFEELTGARFTTSYSRIGGVARDVPEGWLERVDAFCVQFLPNLEEVLNLLTRNKIFMDRTVGIGVISREDAIAYGLTGPNLRGSGVPLDLRKDRPYSGYEQYDFDVAVGAQGDSYDRYLVRGEEMRQSVRIIRQAVAKFPPGKWSAEEARKVVQSASLTSTCPSELVALSSPRKSLIVIPPFGLSNEASARRPLAAMSPACSTITRVWGGTVTWTLRSSMYIEAVLSRLAARMRMVPPSSWAEIAPDELNSLPGTTATVTWNPARVSIVRSA